LPFAFGIPGFTLALPPDFRMSMVHGADVDPHVLAELHISAGCGSSQMYLLLALATILPNIMTAVTSAKLLECNCILMVDTSLELWNATLQLKTSAGWSYFPLFPSGQTITLLTFQGSILRPPISRSVQNHQFSYVGCQVLSGFHEIFALSLFCYPSRVNPYRHP
jgi:hypothetical protein